MGTYVPNTVNEQLDMLKCIGASSMEELFAAVPDEVKLHRGLNIPGGRAELEVRRQVLDIAGMNKVYRSIFRGCGAYNHYIPAIVKQVTKKEEFLTAYTPYQAEISQGILQSIFEYQTMMCELTGMDVSNASVYDGATAAAEAVLMCKEKHKSKALISGLIHPQTMQVIRTYVEGTGMEVEVIPGKNGRTDIDALRAMLDESTACVLLQQPNFYGLLEAADTTGELLKDTDVKYIISCNPISLGILKAPAEYGADIAVGEGQPLGMPLSFGGPYLGFMATKSKLMRRLPGRIVGETVDNRGNRAFVLTLQAREQHIRREKASSNICSNQALCAMTAAVYLSAMGSRGLRQAAKSSMSIAHYLADRLCSLEGYRMVYPGEFFNEFVTAVPVQTEVILEHLDRHGILGGCPLTAQASQAEASDHILWCATEVNTKEEIDSLIDILREVGKE